MAPPGLLLSSLNWSSLRVAVTAAFLFAVAVPARGQLSTLETEDLRLVYFGAAQSYLVPHVARSFENSMRFQRRLFGYESSEKVTVLLNDFADFGNAGVSVIPRNGMMFQIAPVTFVYETLPSNEPVNWTMNHELVHVAAYDQATKGDRLFRGLFRGKVREIPEQPETILYSYLATPRAFAPRWYHEGIATFVETWMAGGRGRAQSAWDEMVFRSMVRDGSRFYDPLGLVSEGTKVDFQLEANSYQYGTRFMSYLAYRYSPDHLVRWVARREGTRRYYASQFREVFGQSVAEAWRSWIAFEKEFQRKNLAAIRTYPTTPYRDLSRVALGGVSRAFFDPGTRKIYAGFNYPGVVAHIGAISVEDGSVRQIAEVKDPLGFMVTSLAFDPEAGTLFYTTDNHEYRDVRALDPRTGQSRILLEEARIGELVFNRADRSLWGVRVLNGIASLVRIPPPYTDWKHVRSWPYGETPYDMDISPDGKLLSASVSEINGNHTLRVMQTESLLAGDATPVAVTDFGTAIPMNFVFSADGKHLYGSSYLTGVANVFRYDLGTGRQEALSNTETGFFRPVPMPDGSLVVFRYSGEGFVPARIAIQPTEDVSAITFFGNDVIEKFPELKEWKVPSPAAIPLDSLVTSRGPYRSFASVGLESLYPVLQGYKDSAAIGMRLNFSDPAQLNRANVTASYTPDRGLPSDERFHVDARYERYDWSARFRWNAGDFYDLFGPTKTSMKGFAYGVGYQKALVSDKPRELRLKVNATFYDGLDRLPDFQNVATSFDRLFAARAVLRYENLRHSLGHVDEEKGHAWEIGLANDLVHDRSYPKVWGTFDVGHALPIKHSSLWLRNAAGYTRRVPDQPFASFYFGGFGNNWVDHGNEKRYRELLSFPGADLNEIPGSNFAKSMLEWNLPPVRFREAGTADFYVTWVRPALFVSALATNMDTLADRHVVGSVGAQVDFRLFVLSRLEMTLSVGQAVAVEDHVGPRYETMVSLKILK